MHGFFLSRLWSCNGTLLPDEHCLFFLVRIYQEEDQPATGSTAARFSGLEPQSRFHVHNLVLLRI